MPQRRYPDPCPADPQPFPEFRKNMAPGGLATRRQLRARGLRPAGHDPVAQIRYWRHGWRLAFLYRLDLAQPVRPMTEGRWRAVDAMMRARRTCRQCGTERQYVIPASVGRCNVCDGVPGAQ
ncbi:RRQRL motif-containing zinc-binding protein [Streptomyces rubiginosohelvolus]|uniref:RRQRL motif-containing zinc-binding protein n=1 Tax=Streptomyces rubiginosohelvolus TaxID=67362 RepID=UPI0035D9BDD1